MAAESKTEQACRKYAESVGCHLYKIKFLGRVGCPDRMLVIPESVHEEVQVVLVEFKSPRQTLSDVQLEVCKNIRNMGLRVWVIRGIETFKALLDELNS